MPPVSLVRGLGPPVRGQQRDLKDPGSDRLTSNLAYRCQLGLPQKQSTGHCNTQLDRQIIHADITSAPLHTLEHEAIAPVAS